MLRVSDHHHRSVGGQRGHFHIQPLAVLARIAGFACRRCLRQQDHGGRRILDDAARRVHRAYRRNMPAVVDRFELVPRRRAKCGVIAYQ